MNAGVFVCIVVTSQTPQRLQAEQDHYFFRLKSAVRSLVPQGRAFMAVVRLRQLSIREVAFPGVDAEGVASSDPMRPLRGLGGGERGIRTPDTLVAYTRLAGEHLRPLGQLSVKMCGKHGIVLPAEMQGCIYFGRRKVDGGQPYPMPTIPLSTPAAKRTSADMWATLARCGTSQPFPANSTTCPAARPCDLSRFISRRSRRAFL